MNSTQRLWLVRHGNTQWNSTHRFCGHSDIPLSPNGHMQARWLARRLRDKPIRAIYSSDLSRARATAKTIVAQHNHAIPIHYSQAWREINFGAWEGLTYATIAAQYPDQLAFFSEPEQHSPPGGESLTTMLQRVQYALLALLIQSEPGDIVLVSHGGPLRALLCQFLQMPLSSQWQLRLDPGSLSCLDIIMPDETQHRYDTLPAGILVTLNMQKIERK